MDALKFKKSGYKQWKYGDWTIANNAIDYSIENKNKEFYARTDSLKNAKHFVTCRILGLDYQS